MGRKNGGAPFRYLAIIGIILCTAGGAMAADPVLIMPCGDSITYDNFSGDTRPAGLRTGYRQPLWLLLQNAGYNVDFVGSAVAGDLAVPAFDPDNEGHPGWTDAMIAENIYGWLTANPADIVLLHIGTNAADVQGILDEIDRYEGDTGSTVTVLLARIINRVAYSADTTLFNDNVEAMANARIAAGDDIVMVDMEDGAGLDYALDTSLPYDDGDMYDDLHPNDRGYGKMAAKWYQHLVQILPPGVDADSDGISDDVENAVVCLDPGDDDSDDDGILDGNEDTNRNGVVDPGETDPCNPDSDGDFLPDGLEIGLTAPQGTGTDPTVVVWDEDPDTTTDPLREDTDGDGLRDGEEDVNVNGDSPVGDGTFTGSLRDYFGVEASMTTQMSFLEGSSPDIDKDGVVDGTDLALLVKAYNSEDGDDNYNSACDIIPNDAIDQNDLEAFAAGFGITNAVQGPITFTSNFDNGNGTNFTESPDNQINFKVEIDPAPADILWNKWFHIRLDNVQGKTLSIRPDWSGDRGMTSFYPYLYEQDPVYGYDGVNWTFVMNTYWSQPIERFTVPLSGTSTNSTIYVAAGLPYTYGMLQNDILSWQASGKLSTSTVLGTSTYGRNIYYMVLGTGSRGVGITARTHPNEATGSYYLKGIMDFLTSDDPAAVTLRSEFTFHVFPMVNPDGVYLGKTRSFASGEDANRDFDITGPNASTEEPETYLIHQRYHQIKDDIVFHIDCHTNHTEPMMWRDSATFPSALESQIVSRIGTYESTGIVKPTFTQWDVPDTAWMGGVKAEYGIDAVTFEGGIFRDDQRNGHVTASELEQIGKGNLQACLNGYLAYESNGATGNDFTGDSDVAAVYDFEPGALGADDSGNGNTLTAYNSPASDTTYYKRGSGSVSYVRNDVDYQMVSDANLASGFPLKSSYWRA